MMAQVPKRVLIVDDSATLRRIIRARLARDPRLVVVGEASDAFEARAQIKALKPDVLTLDVEMPRMSGLDFLERLMRLHPLPVIMISTETQKGSAAALEALSLGAVDCVGKPSNGDLISAFEELADLLVAAADAHIHNGRGISHLTPSTDFTWNGRYVLIGSSTGGVTALEHILKSYPENCPPTLIAQHMPESFLASFARRLNGKIGPTIQVAQDGQPLQQGNIYVAPGGEHHLAISTGDTLRCRLIDGAKVSGHRPSVDVLFKSAVPVAQDTCAFILTGMGRDGAAGMGVLRKAGARCFAQDAESSVVFGMPRVALEEGAAEAALALSDIPKVILDLCGASGSRRMMGSR
ncbi:chemotaxis-specific protein-glutamate methyltransferase CheB [Thioclava sp. A2]|uniref:chemotaxis-specific protein-glutamate methyltransferase CheB n=1 Tax=Thioclava sp. FCG-A2 TaxID=3080562 RepID=UPI002955C6DA|nr:chemotaxis-specific protein-glutamate methyltransferase CheB [Thioclava sp. A2]MDV7269789.1 chemotaxis-specific protein-glutamate methyltransferase CheB [Thioclava sp. A2]